MKSLNEMLRGCLRLFRPAILKLFKQIWETGIFPKDRMKSIIVPLHKKGKNDDPENYRGMSLTSNLCKCFTYIINKRLTDWANVDKVILEEQDGYWVGYSRVDQIFVLYSLMHRVLCRNKLYACLVEFRKACDTIERNQLWQVLLKLRSSIKMVNCLKGLSADVKSCVTCVRVYNNEFTDFFDLKDGSRQGCLFSPMLFSFNK